MIKFLYSARSRVICKHSEVKKNNKLPFCASLPLHASELAKRHAPTRERYADVVEQLERGKGECVTAKAKRNEPWQKTRMEKEMCGATTPH